MYHTTDRSGITELKPDDAKLWEILAEIDDEEGDASAPEVWLTHLESGWSLSVWPGGLLTLENTLRTEPERSLRDVEPERIFALWKRLAAGEIELLLQEPWLSEA
ncbi:MAG: hypothetical protein AAGA45_03835 [Verrucomicrobiota bacterium]